MFCPSYLCLGRHAASVSELAISRVFTAPKVRRTETQFSYRLRAGWAPLRNCDQQTAADACGLLVSRAEAVIVPWLQIPTELALLGRPEHEIEHGLAGNGVRADAIRVSVNPSRPDAGHKLHFRRKGPGLLEKKIRIPFGRMSREERCHSCFQLQPVLNRRHLDRYIRAEA